MNRNAVSTMELFDLPWNDILIKKVMVYVLPNDWLSLRIVSKRTYQLVSDYLSKLSYLDLSTCKYFPEALWRVSCFTVVKVDTLLMFFHLSRKSE